MDGVITIPRRPDTGTEPSATAIIDVRCVPLAELATDSDAREMVRKILDGMDGCARLSVAKFNSAI